MRASRPMLIAAAFVAAAALFYTSPYTVGPLFGLQLSVQQAPAKANTGEFGDIFSRPVLKKGSQLKFLIFIADGPNGIVEGPMSRIQADAEMKLYVDANPTLMVEDGHGGYIATKSRQPMQNLLAARDPDWNK